MCEPNLFREFNAGFQKLNFEVKDIELLNSDDFIFDIQVLDFQQYFGASINREDNRLRALRRIPSKRKNFDAFMPDDV